MYASMYSTGLKYQTRLAGPFERPSGVGYHLEIIGNMGTDSISLVADARILLDLAEQINQIAQELMRQQLPGGRKDEQPYQSTQPQP